MSIDERDSTDPLAEDEPATSAGDGGYPDKRRGQGYPDHRPSRFIDR